MKQVCLFVLLMLISAGLAGAQARNPVPSDQVLVNPQAQSAAIRILTPVAGETLGGSFVDLRFELVRPAASDEPNFLVQLDAHDPVNTSSTDYTFTDLQPGVHTVRVTLVDANNVPVDGGAATVQFKVPPPSNLPAKENTPHSDLRSDRIIAGAAPELPLPPELRRNSDMYLPMAGSALPVLSIIGFGLLLGGVVQTMRGRRHQPQH